jgi:phage nucleotide-binding protein
MPLNITKAAELEVSQKVCGIVYGQPGAGKTTTLARAKNCLILDLEKSTRYLRNSGLGDVHVAHIESWKELQDAYKEVLNSDYDTIVIDSASSAIDLLKEQIKKEDRGSFLPNGNPKLATYGIMSTRFEAMQKAYMTIPGKNIIFTAHTQAVQVSDEVSRIVPKLTSKNVDPLIRQAYVSLVGFMPKTGILTFNPSDSYLVKDATGKLNGKTFNMNETTIDEILSGTV